MHENKNKEERQSRSVNLDCPRRTTGNVAELQKYSINDLKTRVRLEGTEADLLKMKSVLEETSLGHIVDGGMHPIFSFNIKNCQRMSLFIFQK